MERLIEELREVSRLDRVLKSARDSGMISTGDSERLHAINVDTVHDIVTAWAFEQERSVR